MSKSQKNSSEEFDRSVCFTFFSSWVETLHNIADYDLQAALTAFFILSDFCLYGIEPDPKTNPWGFAWPLVEREARRSINNRRRGFSAEDTELSDAIRVYHAEHPEASQRAIARELCCSVGKVNKVLKAKPEQNSPAPLNDGGAFVHGGVHGKGSGKRDCLFPHPVEQDECEIFGMPLPNSGNPCAFDIPGEILPDE